MAMIDRTTSSSNKLKAARLWLLGFMEIRAVEKEDEVIATTRATAIDQETRESVTGCG